MRKRVEAARTTQQERFKETNLQTNSDSAKPPRGMEPGEIRQYCSLDQTSTNLVETARQQMQLSAWAYHRTRNVKLARIPKGHRRLRI